MFEKYHWIMRPFKAGCGLGSDSGPRPLGCPLCCVAAVLTTVIWTETIYGCLSVVPWATTEHNAQHRRSASGGSSGDPTSPSRFVWLRTLNVRAWGLCFYQFLVGFISVTTFIDNS